MGTVNQSQAPDQAAGEGASSGVAVIGDSEVAVIADSGVAVIADSGVAVIGTSGLGALMASRPWWPAGTAPASIRCPWRQPAEEQHPANAVASEHAVGTGNRQAPGLALGDEHPVEQIPDTTPRHGCLVARTRRPPFQGNPTTRRPWQA